MNLGAARQTNGGVDRRIDALRQIIIHRGSGHIRFGIAPAGHVHIKAIVEQVFNQALLRRQIHDVELVDPRGDQHDGRRPLPPRGRRVVQHLDKFVAEDDSAGRKRQIFPDLMRR